LKVTKNAIIVADAGPLIALAKCDKLGLLTLIFSEVNVPQTVFNEAIGGRLKPETDKIRAFVLENCVLQPDRQDELLSQLTERLDEGESQAISWAHHLDCALLMDEKRGRQVAKSYGLVPIGVLGLLLVCKRAGYIDAIAPIIDTMRQHNYLLSDQLIQTVLTASGELKVE
jgi:uncharacterized protein